MPVIIHKKIYMYPFMIYPSPWTGELRWDISLYMHLPLSIWCVTKMSFYPLQMQVIHEISIHMCVRWSVKLLLNYLIKTIINVSHPYSNLLYLDQPFVNNDRLKWTNNCSLSYQIQQQQIQIAMKIYKEFYKVI